MFWTPSLSSLLLGYAAILAIGPVISVAADSDLAYQGENPESVPASADYTATGTVAAAPVDSSGWKTQTNGFFNLSQNYYDNWVKGGSNSMAWELHFDEFAVLDMPKYTWENKGKAVYGRTQLGDLNSRKSADELNLKSTYIYKLGAWVNPFAGAELQTQFAAGYNYPNPDSARVRASGPFDPTFLYQTVGVGFTTVKNLNLRLGATLKETFSDTSYGIADDKETAKIESFKFEPGASFFGSYKIDVWDNIQLSTALDVFVNFKGMDEVDGKWENVVTAKVNDFINVNFTYDMLYDFDLSDSYQSKEGLAVGISFLKL